MSQDIEQLLQDAARYGYKAREDGKTLEQVLNNIETDTGGTA